tara:strand:- start:37 stop:330 length:294 start_codon:yes stop_codon:yes gene_type:complete
MQKLHEPFLWKDEKETLEDVLELAQAITKAVEEAVRVGEYDPNLVCVAMLFSACQDIISYADVEHQDLQKDEELNAKMKIILDEAFRLLRGQPLALN